MSLSFTQTSDDKTFSPDRVVIASKISVTSTARKKRTKKNCEFFYYQDYFLVGCTHNIYFDETAVIILERTIFFTCFFYEKYIFHDLMVSSM